jgi:hypothetical protein
MFRRVQVIARFVETSMPRFHPAVAITPWRASALSVARCTGVPM